MHEPLVNTDLLAMLRENKTLGIEMLFRLHYAELCHSVVRITGSRETAEDLVQDVFHDLWKKPELDIQSNPASYLRRAATNKALNWLRNHKQWEQIDEPELLPQLPDVHAVQPLEGTELSLKINQAIEALPERCRAVFVLSRFEELSHQEIASQLNISTKTVENQITKALKTLKQLLSGSISILITLIIKCL